MAIRNDVVARTLDRPRVDGTIGNFPKDGQTVLEPGILICKHDNISEGRGNRPHRRTLQTISLSGTSEHHNHPPLRPGAHGSQSLLKTVRRMREIYDHVERLSPFYPFHPSRNSSHRRNALQRLGERDPDGA